MGLEAEVEALRQQNRRLKMALFSIVAVCLLGIVTAAGLAAIAATQARAQALIALEREHLARAHAQAAMEKAKEALERVEGQSEDEP